VGATGDPAGTGIEGTGREAESGKGVVDETVLDDCPADDELVLLDLKASRSRPKTDVGRDGDLSRGVIARIRGRTLGRKGAKGLLQGAAPAAQAVQQQQGSHEDRRDDLREQLGPLSRLHARPLDSPAQCAATRPVRLLAAASRHLLRQSPATPVIGACEDCSCL
jgi:hypothetical protein